MTDAQSTKRRLPGAERRVLAPHPGPTIAREYLEPLGLEARAFAALIDMDGARLEAILAGTSPFDVDAAVRVSRALGIAPDRLMRDQLRHDFALARATENERPTAPIDTLVHRPFPQRALHGHLARAEAADRHERLFFVDDVHEEAGTDASTHDGMRRVRAVSVGDRLRVYGPDGNPVWAGPVLRDLDGRPLFAFAPRYLWQRWFATGALADYAPVEANAGAGAGA